MTVVLQYHRRSLRASSRRVRSPISEPAMPKQALTMRGTRVRSKGDATLVSDVGLTLLDLGRARGVAIEAHGGERPQ